MNSMVDPAPTSPADGALSRRAVSAILATVAMAAFSPGCGKSEAEPSAAQEEVKAKPVRVVQVAKRTFTNTARVQSDVVPAQKATILPKVPGTILAMKADVGDHVKKNQVLARLDRTDFGIAWDQAGAGVAQAQAGLDQARINLETAETNFNRFKTLHDEKAVTDADFEKVEIGFRMARAQVRLAESGLRAARAGKKSVGKKLTDATVRAPFAGVVAARMKDAGEMASPQAPLFVVMNMDPVKIEGEITAAEAARAKVGTPVPVTVAALPERTFAGVVERVFPSVNPVSRTVKIRVSLPNPDYELKAGMAAEFAIDLGTEEALAVPRESVIIDGVGRGHVYVVSAEGIAERRDMKVVEAASEWLKVRAGVVAGERVVTGGAADMKSGAAVEIVETRGQGE